MSALLTAATVLLALALYLGALGADDQERIAPALHAIGRSV